MFKLIVLIIALAMAAPLALAETHRDPVQRRDFMHQHPCPSIGKTKGRCPGYVVDHINPLCAGGADHPSKMLWQTMAEAKNKDRLEREQCKRR